jgi:uncharacterized protein
MMRILSSSHEHATTATTALRPVGEYFELDEHGYVMNPASADRIIAPWDGVVAQVVDACRAELGARLCAIYARGSVTRGAAVVGLSDIDMFAFVRDGGAMSREWVDELARDVACRYEFEPRLDLVLYRVEEVAASAPLRMVMKTQSVRLYGDDLCAGIGEYRPGPEMMLEVPWIGQEVEGHLRKLEQAADEGEVRRLCRGVTKMMVRCGFEMVMEREQRYTNSLYYCYQSFVTHYPEHEPSMRECLELFLNPTGDAERLRAFLQGFGAWLVGETTRLYGDFIKR